MMVLLWIDEILYLWRDYRQRIVYLCLSRGSCELMKFCIFDVIIDNNGNEMYYFPVLWIDEILYLWRDYRQPLRVLDLSLSCCELMKFCIFDVIIDNT